jgi:hypothetical protein
VHGETVAHPMAFGLPMNAENVFHGTQYGCAS